MRILTACAAALATFVLTACGGGGSGTPSEPFTITQFGGMFGVDLTPPAPARTSPSIVIPVYFNAKPDQASLTGASSLVNAATGQAMPLTVVTANGLDAALRPATNLAYNTSYTLTIRNTARSADGRQLDRTYTKTFLTQDVPYRIRLGSFSVTRYSDATVRVPVTITGAAISERGEIRATCTEDGYGNLSTSLRGPLPQGATGTSVTVVLTLAGGYPTFTDNPVRCSFSASVDSKIREVTIE